MTQESRHIQARIIGNQPDKPQENVAVRVWDELRKARYSPRQIITDALVALGTQKQTPAQRAKASQVDSNAIAQQVTQMVRQSMMDEMRELANAVITLSNKLKSVGAGFVIGEYDNPDMEADADADFDDDDFDDEYALAIANAVLTRTESED